MKNEIKNLPASIHQRLLNQAKADQRSFNELLQYFAMERFLYRCSQSRHSRCVILKGALMLKVWEAGEFRSTKDIDLLAQNISNDLKSMVELVKDIIAVQIEPDGLNFQPDSVTVERITEDADYGGVRVKFIANLGNAIINMQMDVGFGDLIYPGPAIMELPSMLDFPRARLLCYSRESSIAEKLQAMIHLGDSNSRMKDFYDIYTLSRRFNFQGIHLAEAIRLTFKNRQTDIPLSIPSFGPEFAGEKQLLWNTFHKKLDQGHVPEDFTLIASNCEKFLGPIVKALSSGVDFSRTWNAPGPWL
jgi:hypothetical protein